MLLFIGGILITYPVTFLINLDHIKDIVKDAANNGYLINPKYFKDIKNGSDNESTINKYIKYIPVANICDSLVTNLAYKFNRQEEFEMLRITGAFNTMTKEEEEEYKKKPTVLRALNLSSIKEKKEEKLIESYKNRSVNHDENIVKEIVKLDKELTDHDIIKEKDNKEEIISVEELINSMSKEELEEFKDSLLVFKEYDKHFDDEPKGEYIIDSKNDKVLKLNFKNRGE